MKQERQSDAINDELWIPADGAFASSDDDESTCRARRIARALHSKYKHEVERWKSYEALFAFLGFMVLLLAVLYLQSNAHTAFQVHATIQAIVPTTASMTSSDAVLRWIQQTLQNLWRDPVCGDGICATPFEFASYGRFGCRADCGKLPEVQHLTMLQIDLYFDFHHPVKSIASAELMQQASWNLCPADGAPHGMDCYFDEAQRFASIKGEMHVVLNDIPDGKWEIRIKRDFFDKIRGAVRVVDRLKEQAAWNRKYGAYLAARADQDFEIDILEEAIRVAKTPALNYTMQQSEKIFNETLAQYLVDLQEGRLSSIDFDAQNETLHIENALAEEQYRRAVCLCSENNFETKCDDETPGAFLDETDDGGSPLSPGEICERIVNQTAQSIEDRLAEVRYMLSVKRLGGSDGHNGKIGKRAQKKAEQRKYIESMAPELYDAVFVNVDGTTPDTDIQLNHTKYDILAKYFSDGPIGYLDPTLLIAQQRLTKSSIQASNLSELISRSRSRIDEIRGQQNEVARLDAVSEMRSMYGASPIIEKLETELLPTFIEYNHVEWNGGADAYLRCNLPERGPQYVGNCIDQTLCTRANNTDAYTCPDSLNLTSEECSKQCSFQDDCAALCSCNDTCHADKLCACDACESLEDALATTEYKSLQELAESAGDSPPGRRRLRETADESITEYLTDLSQGIEALRIGQSELKTQVVSLEQEVQTANDLVKQREEDNSLEEVINQGRQEIAIGQESVEGLLIEIIGKQNETLKAVEEATETVRALEELTARSLEAQTAIHVALREQMNAIKIAYQQNLISIEQAAELWRLARRDRLISEKDTHLSTYRCSMDTVVAREFEVDNYREEANVHSRERYVGLNNRIVAGILLHTVRTKPTKCPESRFADIENDCRREKSTESYGVDPIFKAGTTLYDPDLDNAESAIRFYNCSELPSPSYHRLDPYASTERYINDPPFCIELFNMRGVPYGFRSFDLEGRAKGFPIWFDINLSEYEADRWYRYIVEGLFLDENTKTVTAELVVYNAELNIFGYLEVKFDFSDGGTIHVSNQITTARADLYQTTGDFVRLALEIALTGLVVGWFVMAICAIFHSSSSLDLAMKRCFSSWEWIDFTSNVLLLTSVIMWWGHVTRHATPFDIDLSYNVYRSLNPPAAYLKLASDGEGLRLVNTGINKMKRLVRSLTWYYAVNGLSMLLLIARMLKKMDFQPRLGVVTRSIALAGPDLLHFSVVGGLVFFGYAMMAHLIFGSSIRSFSSFGRSVNTCFEILLGDISVNAQLKELSGLQSLAGTLFFWSFELLVFLVLLNFLLAIIVDAFSVVKENTSETTNIHTEIFGMVRQKWRDFIGRMTDANYVPYDRLGAMLHRYGTLDDETDHDDDDVPVTKKSIKFCKEEIDAATMKKVLHRCLEDTTFTELLRKPIVFNSRYLTDNELFKPDDSDLDAIVSSLMQRFGTEKEDAVSDDDNDDREITKSLSRLEKELHESQSALELSLHELASVQKEILSRQKRVLRFTHRANPAD